ncbi:hypothetical protein QNA08_18320 [Chelatococcus sp. SYSU_G07232]|uniref:TFIIB-type domain-containing protein n=1 Tax=Chelatococcus albus TaxID=3047466 RepID=A0ABT7ALB2_9HYPH|nr:hypothetical protein [Chelatococcus sp. SYSU_G07232]MDJ1160172.1 hypothetical protein [Chelatococcus sp. SYSU_G07232]
MDHFGLTAEFACESCGSNSIVLPDVLTDDAAITCSGCGAALGSWRTFKDRVKRVVAADLVAKGRDPNGNPDLTSP